MTDSGLRTQTFGKDRRKIEWQICLTIICEKLNSGHEKQQQQQQRKNIPKKNKNKKTQKVFVLRNSLDLKILSVSVSTK